MTPNEYRKSARAKQTVKSYANKDIDSNPQVWRPNPEPKPTKHLMLCIGQETNTGQLLGRKLCSPLYHQYNLSLYSNMETSIYILTFISVENQKSLTKRLVGLGV